ncbi:hypothetical protein llap_5425 [Limosa lapponica baueri]|uniref:Uncharacterized protein n=1 Tax=Limosa lapponica baueri TaxID=1758121 RepID=A0A2I0UE00_LIMLA|nr:hypothetical protein llap_5425 [Limosa lapponica baueri]
MQKKPEPNLTFLPPAKGNIAAARTSFQKCEDGACQALLTCIDIHGLSQGPLNQDKVEDPPEKSTIPVMKEDEH